MLVSFFVLIVVSNISFIYKAPRSQFGFIHFSTIIPKPKKYHQAPTQR